MKRLIDWIRRAGPEDWLMLLKRLVPHVAIVISGMLIVFFLIDRVNKPIGFMTNEFHKVITFILALVSIALSVMTMAAQRREAREAYRWQLKRAQKQPEPRKADAGGRARETARRTAPAAAGGRHAQASARR